MPLQPPLIDDRDYRSLVEETLARVPVHTPEWTNFNASDPGVTLVHLFAFLTENLIFRANQIPERNRAKFLQLLGIPLRSAQEARGLVTFANDKGPLTVHTLGSDTELLAGQMPFRTAQRLDVLPVEARFYTKRAVSDASDELKAYYALLYASYGRDLDTDDLALYQTVAFDPQQGPFNADDTIDRSLWIGLFARKDDLTSDLATSIGKVREAIGSRMLTLGLVPSIDAGQRTLNPGNATQISAEDSLRFEVAQPNAQGELDFAADGTPQPRWRALGSRFDFDPTRDPGVIEVSLPSAQDMALWSNLDPLETGVGDLPPSLEEPALNDRLVTWVRLSVAASAQLRLDWAGINAAVVRQRETIRSERLADGDGTPDQVRQLSRSPVLEGSVELTSVRDDGATVSWTVVDDLLAAASEVPAQPTEQPLAPATSYRIDAEAGLIRFGDGFAGQRPAAGEKLIVRYDVCAGKAGNLGAKALKAGPLVPAGVTATNPVPTWGGDDPENVSDGERQVQRWLQHRDRLVTAEDFHTIAWRTPGVSIGRIEVLPAWHPDLAPAAVGSAPGTVTLMAIPASDPLNPANPRADDRFLGALCRYLDPRRLVTTELVLRGPIYKGIWVSIGLTVAGGRSSAEVIDAVKRRIAAYLSPLPAPGTGFAGSSTALYAPEADPALRGWPLDRAVHARAILAEAARVPGVVEVADVLLALGAGSAVETVPINGIELPELLGLSVTIGEPEDLATLRGTTASNANGTSSGQPRLPVPIVPETC